MLFSKPFLRFSSIGGSIGTTWGRAVKKGSRETNDGTESVDGALLWIVRLWLVGEGKSGMLVRVNTVDEVGLSNGLVLNPFSPESIGDGAVEGRGALKRARRESRRGWVR